MQRNYEKIVDWLNHCPVRDISIGYQTIILLVPEKLERAQVGYAVTRDGVDLTGEMPGDWQRTWLLIGYDESCGDPIFVDAGNDQLPVFTAMHDLELWEPELIAESLSGFQRLLLALRTLAENREHPVALEANPVSWKEREEFFDLVEMTCEGDVPPFWELLFQIE